MYESFYNFSTKPFALLPDTSFLYQGSEHQTAYNLLEYGILSQAPFMVLTGDPGMGKTSLLQKLIAEHGKNHRIGMVTNARYDIEHLLPWILLSLGLSTKRLDPVEAYHLFSEFLVEESKHHRRVILIVDEAQSLGVELLEELRLLSNMNDGRTLKLQIILSGQPDLHTILQRIDMTQFAQRIVVDYHLKPLSEVDTASCIRHRIQIAGGRPSLFTNKACALVHRLSRGNPRLINQIADIALTYGYAEQAKVITRKLVAQAALDRSKGGILPLASREELIDLAVAPQDPTEFTDPLPVANSTVESANGDQATAALTDSPAHCYEQGMTLKQQGRLRDAVEMFHRAAREKSLWLKAHAQVGLCYSRMKELHAAIEAFRTALNDDAASQKEVVEVLYFLGRSLESDGQTGEAMDIYQRISQVSPDFKDISTRLTNLDPNFKPTLKRHDKSAAGESWISGAINNFQRFLIGTQK